MSLLSTLLLVGIRAEEAPAALVMPNWAFPLIAAAIFTLLGFVLWVLGVVFSIVGFTKAKDGQSYVYPFALRLIK